MSGNRVQQQWKKALLSVLYGEHVVRMMWSVKVSTKFWEDQWHFHPTRFYTIQVGLTSVGSMRLGVQKLTKLSPSASVILHGIRGTRRPFSFNSLLNWSSGLHMYRIPNVTSTWNVVMWQCRVNLTYHVPSKIRRAQCSIWNSTHQISTACSWFDTSKGTVNCTCKSACF